MKAPKLDSMGNERLSFFTRFLLGTSGGAWTLNFMMIQTFLLFVYTDVFKISAAYVAVLFLVTRIVDAILAPAMGILVDVTSTPWGKYKPYFIIFGVPFAITGFLTFTDPTLLFGSISETGMYAYATVTYVLFSTLYSICGAATGGVQPLMTKSIDDRINLGQINSFAAMIAGILVTAAVTPIIISIGGSLNSAKGWMIVMGVISIITIAYNVTGAFVYKEKYLVENVKKEKLTPKQMGVVIFKNRTALIGLAILLGVNLSGGIRSGAMLYYFQYYFNMPALMTIIGLIGLIATLAGTVFSGILSRRIGIKKTIELSAIVSIITGAIAFFAPANQTGVIYYVVVSIIGSFFSGLYMPVYGTLMPAAIDYAEWKFNVVANGYIGSFVGFVQTLATAISGALVAAALAFIGYKSGVATQTENTIMGLRLLTSVIPSVLQIFMMAIVWYDLTEDKQKIITTELMERREKAEEALNSAPAQ